jgi:hypothetical protein
MFTLWCWYPNKTIIFGIGLQLTPGLNVIQVDENGAHPLSFEKGEGEGRDSGEGRRGKEGKTRREGQRREGNRGKGDRRKGGRIERIMGGRELYNEGSEDAHIMADQNIFVGKGGGKGR